MTRWVTIAISAFCLIGVAACGYLDGYLDTT